MAGRWSKQRTTAITLRAVIGVRSPSAFKRGDYPLHVVTTRAVSGREGSTGRLAGGVLRGGVSADRGVGDRSGASAGGRGSDLGCAHRHLGAAGAGMTRHQAMGEESAAVGVVFAGARAPGRLFRAVRDGAVTVHDQLSEAAPHPSPPHRCAGFTGRGTLVPRSVGEVSGAASARRGVSLRGFRNIAPIPPVALSGSPVTAAGEPAPDPGRRSSRPPR
jgi:hypothetical protein